MFKNFWKYRSLLFMLVWRDIRVRYKQSILGIGWALFLPLAMTLIFTFVFTSVVKIEGLKWPYPIYASCGLIPWTFFANSLNQATRSLVANRNLVTKIYFPREVFPLASVLSLFVDFLIAWLILAGLIAWSHAGASGWSPVAIRPTILLVPVVVFVQLLFTMGLAMLLGCGNLFYRDVSYVVTVLVRVWMFMTNVLYPVERVESAKVLFVLRLNPMTPIIGAYRDLILDGRLPRRGPFIYATVVSVAVFLLCWLVFKRNEFKFAERI